MAAYVEIVFDNSDGKYSKYGLFFLSKALLHLFTGRLSVDSDEVIIRRTVG